MDAPQKPSADDAFGKLFDGCLGLIGGLLTVFGGIVTVLAGCLLGAYFLSRIGGGRPESVLRAGLVPWLIFGAAPLFLGCCWGCGEG